MGQLGLPPWAGRACCFLLAAAAKADATACKVRSTHTWLLPLSRSVGLTGSERWVGAGATSRVVSGSLSPPPGLKAHVQVLFGEQ